MNRPLPIAVLVLASTVSARSQEPTASYPPAALTENAPSDVQLRWFNEFNAHATEHFVITHGLGGTLPGDRFYGLAAAIVQAIPAANVLILDWSAVSNSRLGPLPNPWKVAGNIDTVARQSAEQLAALSLDRAHLTLIGESFGNCVNSRIAQQLEGVGRILAFNPPNEAGGYPVPDLRQCANRCWSFHTYSVFDSLHEIAHQSFFLETPPDATDFQQHMAGIAWLASRLFAGDPSWLLNTISLPEQNVRNSDYFAALATLDGKLRAVQLPRKRPESDNLGGIIRTPLVAK